MSNTRTLARFGLGGVLVAESMATWARWENRRRLFHAATERARTLGRPCVVVLPDQESTVTRALRAYEYGRAFAQLIGGRGPNVVRAHELQRGRVARIGDNSAVVYAACVLEYVDDVARVMDEIVRMAGELDNVFLVTVQPWTLTAALHPRARWAGIADTHVVSMGRSRPCTARSPPASSSASPRRPCPRRPRPPTRSRSRSPAHWARSAGQAADGH